MFSQKIHGANHILGINTNGTPESVSAITIDDLKVFYKANLHPSVSNFLIAGNINKNQVVQSLNELVSKWQTKEVVFPEYALPEPLQKSLVVFVDVPGAKQSVINIGNLSLARTEPDYFPARVMNDHLGGNFLSLVNLVLREQKGFTYGAATYFNGSYIKGPFVASSMVRSSATLESIQIFKELMVKYRSGISETDLEMTRNYLLKSYTQDFETLDVLTGMLNDISLYNLPVDFVRKEQETIKSMTVEQHKALAQKYINPSKMYYVVAGDAKTQLKELEKLGFGKPVLVTETN